MRFKWAPSKSRIHFARSHLNPPILGILELEMPHLKANQIPLCVHALGHLMSPLETVDEKPHRPVRDAEEDDFSPKTNGSGASVDRLTRAKGTNTERSVIEEGILVRLMGPKISVETCESYKYRPAARAVPGPPSFRTSDQNKDTNPYLSTSVHRLQRARRRAATESLGRLPLSAGRTNKNMDCISIRETPIQWALVYFASSRGVRLGGLKVRGSQWRVRGSAV